MRLVGLVIGASGYVGRHLLRELGEGGVGTYRTTPFEGGIRFDATEQRIGEAVPDLSGRFTHAFVLYGAIDMDRCARDPDATSRVNVATTQAVLDDLFAAGVKPVFISTDYVFPGTRSWWTEEDEPAPCMAYGAQKLDVEHWLCRRSEEYLVARLSKNVSGETGVHSMLGQWAMDIRERKTMRCAVDQHFCPMFVGDTALALRALAESGANGVFHVAGAERYSRLGLLEELANAIQAVDASVQPDVVPAKLHDFFAECRPHDTSLDTRKLRATVDLQPVSMRTLCGRIAQEHFGRGSE